MNRRLLAGTTTTLALLLALLSFTRPAVGAMQGASPEASPRVVSTAAVYMTLSNAGDSEDRLLSGQTDVAETVEIHETVGDGGVMQMRQLSEGLVIPAGEDVTLEPGGYHVMLIGLAQDINLGMTFDLTLNFEQAGETTVEVQVRPRAELAGDATPVPPTMVGDITIANVWSRPAPALGGGTDVNAGTPAAGTPAASAPTSILVATDPELGSYLTDGEGRTLYVFANDTEPDVSTCYDQCAEVWPPFYVEGEVTLPAGVDGSIATVSRDDGSEQLAYGGKPLYYFQQDEGPGDTKGEGVGDVWSVAPVETSGA